MNSFVTALLILFSTGFFVLAFVIVHFAVRLRDTAAKR